MDALTKNGYYVHPKKLFEIRASKVEEMMLTNAIIIKRNGEVVGTVIIVEKMAISFPNKNKITCDCDKVRFYGKEFYGEDSGRLLELDLR